MDRDGLIKKKEREAYSSDKDSESLSWVDREIKEGAGKV
jgi:hypothetical protein